ncbi:ankyrin repeat-containing protein [Fusarium flagelliforme]|uniref:Ankyrin repeat containing protein n=1 Tax=Fusarium flagelliforme TaxID=2675880 RepID=A0A395MC89_9HYPO|nr:ankyrin repeat-containing protein [Fusarium flagelliforme]KAH7196372.1 ankyrin repeat-containing protein [Fusarium flagelliforme]RFN45446.1 ankyrin repeat containing protein [Fusarium flagelliforme]
MSLPERLSTVSTTLSPPGTHDHNRAQQLMSEYKAEVNKSDGVGYSYKDANGVLAKIAQGIILDATPGLVHALFTYKANVSIARFKSTNLWKSIVGKDQVDIRSHVLEQALRTCSDPIIYCMAQKADQISLNEALPIAINLGDTLKTYMLLERGADMSKLCQPFQTAIEKGSDEMIETLTRDGNGVCQNCLNTGLVQAAKLGFWFKAQILLQNGADVGFDQAAALMSTIRDGYEAIAETISGSPGMRNYPLLMDTALAEAYGLEQYRIIDVLLSSGAKGPNMNTVLRDALQKDQLSLARTLAKHGATVHDDAGPWLLSAVQSGRPELLQVALQSNPDEELLRSAITHAAKLSDINICYEMTTMLLATGALDVSVCTQTLIQVLGRDIRPEEETRQKELINLLLQQGKADINLFDGRCLALVVSQGRTELLDLLLQQKPSPETLIVALGSAMDLVVADLRGQIVQTILNSKTGDDQVDVGLLDRLREAAIVAAAKSLRLEILHELSSDESTKAVFSTALATLASANPKWMSPAGLTMVQALLVRGASGPALNAAFREAVKHCEHQAVSLLMDFVDDEAFDDALSDLVQQSNEWHSSEHLEMIEELVSRCSVRAVNEFLLAAITACATVNASEDIIDTIFDVRSTADVNYKNGEPLKRAIEGGSVSVLRRLIGMDTTEETVVQSFMAAITYRLDEATVLAILDVLVEEKGTGFDRNRVLPSGLPPLAACMSTHPRSEALVKRLVKLGCYAEARFSCKIFDDKEAEPEDITILHWALCPQKDDNIGIKAIAKLIDAKVDLNTATSISRSSPLIVATHHQRSDVVAKLLEAGANPDSRDVFNCSALYYSSQSGNADIAKRLVKANSRVNDGSLHEAARNLHSKVVEVLIKGKHDPNFPSTRPEHEGRTAVQELSLRCDASKDFSELENTFLALEKGKANFLAQYDRRNALFLALKSLHPYQTVSALLNTVMWKDLNDERNVFTTTDAATGSKCSFSPTMYLQHGWYSGDPAEIDSLMSLFHQVQCVDRFYAEPGLDQIDFVQLHGATGMPKHLQEAEDRRRTEEEKQRLKDMEHERKLNRQREEAQLKADIDHHSHQQKMDQSVVSHQTKMTQGAQVAKQQQAALERKQATLIAAQRHTDQSKARAAQQKQLQEKQKLHIQELRNKDNLEFQKKKNRLNANALATKKAYSR